MIFRIPPFRSPLIRAVKKEQKHYHFDWTLIKNPSLRFENLVAVHLLKWSHCRQDLFGENIALRYVRDTDKREIDFCLVQDLKQKCFIECKWQESPTSPHLLYFQKKFPKADFFQISALGKKEFINKNKMIHMPALKFLKRFI